MCCQIHLGLKSQLNNEVQVPCLKGITQWSTEIMFSPITYYASTVSGLVPTRLPWPPRQTSEIIVIEPGTYCTQARHLNHSAKLCKVFITIIKSFYYHFRREWMYQWYRVQRVQWWLSQSPWFIQVPLFSAWIQTASRQAHMCRYWFHYFIHDLMGKNITCRIVA